VYRFLSLLVLLLAANSALASVLGEHVRGTAVSDQYPQKLSVKRFTDVRVDDMACEWENAGGFEVKTDRGNYKLKSFMLAPRAIKVFCSGKQPFYIFSLPPSYLGMDAAEGDVGVWFGDKKQRYGCEGYTGCDQVHIIHLYRHADQVTDEEKNLQSW
jgi:hypothetical protein